MNCLHPAILALTLCATAQAQNLQFVPHQFIAENGQTVAAELGSLTVPERHGMANGRTIALKFVRFKSLAARPGNPIVYLAGGPGGSGIGAAAGKRFALFMQLREVADVIALDQRGSGASGKPPACHSAAAPSTDALDLPAYLAAAQRTAVECAAFWKGRGIDLDAYTTRESAADIAMLRGALGAPRLDLWGISYGTHLALATLKYHPATVGRLVLASTEGLSQTIKMPHHTDAMLRRLAGVLARDPLASKAYPDFLNTVSAVHHSLARQSVKVSLPGPTGAGDQVHAIGALDVQLLTSYMVKNPAEAAMLPGMYASMAAGRFDDIAPFIVRIRQQQRHWQLMPMAMDAASGISAARWRQVQAQATSSYLGRASDLPFPDVNRALGVGDLGDDFRAEPHSDTPALFIAGDLDGRTSLDSQMEVAQGFRHAERLIVRNAGHDLLVATPVVGATMLRFLRGERTGDTETTIPAPHFP